jgi:hypothetical protein
MRDKSFIPFGPDPSWYERHWFTEDGPSRTSTMHPRNGNRWTRRTWSTALIALAFFSVAAACGAGLGHLHIYP